MLTAACCGCFGSSKSRHLIYKTKLININMYITMLNPPRGLMIELFSNVNILSNVIWFKTEFSALYLQSLVSHDPLEIMLIWWFDAQETFLIMINVQTVVRIHIYVESMKSWLNVI